MKLKQILLIIGLICCIGLLIAPVVGAESCDGVKTNIISCNGSKGGVIEILLLAINILTGGIGVAAIGGIIYGSVLWSSSGGSSDGVKKAKEVIMNVVIGIVAWAVMYSLLNFFIPGGLFAP